MSRLLVKALLSSLLVTWGLARAGESPLELKSIIAAVGKLESIAEVEPDPGCPTASSVAPSGKVLERICVPAYTSWRATYSIKDVVYGWSPGNTVTFVVNDHYGFPQIAYFDHALLFLVPDESGYALLPNVGSPVFPVAGGGWAGCFLPWSLVDTELFKLLRPMNFEPSVELDLSAYSQAYRELVLDGGSMEVFGDTVKCVQGVPVHTIFEHERDTVLTVRGFFSDNSNSQPPASSRSPAADN